MSYRVENHFRYYMASVYVHNGHCDTVLAVTGRLIGSPQLGDVCSFAALHTHTRVYEHTQPLLWLAYRYSVCHCQCRPALARSFYQFLLLNFIEDATDCCRTERQIQRDAQGSADIARVTQQCLHGNCSVHK